MTLLAAPKRAASFHALGLKGRDAAGKSVVGPDHYGLGTNAFSRHSRTISSAGIRMYQMLNAYIFSMFWALKSKPVPGQTRLKNSASPNCAAHKKIMLPSNIAPDQISAGVRIHGWPL